MRWLAAFVLLAAPAGAQIISPLQAGSSVDTSNLATKADLAGKADTAAITSLQAQIPTPSSSVPIAEIPGGAAGTGNTFRRGDAVQPRITRAVTCTTASNGQCAADWSSNPLSAVPNVLPIPTIASGAGQGTICWPVTGTVTTTGATIRCLTSQSVTISVLGAVVAPLTTAASGVTVQVFAIPLS